MHAVCWTSKNKRAEESLVLEWMGGRATGKRMVDYLSQECCGWGRKGEGKNGPREHLRSLNIIIAGKSDDWLHGCHTVSAAHRTVPQCYSWLSQTWCLQSYHYGITYFWEDKSRKSLRWLCMKQRELLEKSWKTWKLWECRRLWQGAEARDPFRQVVQDVAISGWVGGRSTGTVTAEQLVKAQGWHVSAFFILYSKVIHKSHFPLFTESLWTPGQDTYHNIVLTNVTIAKVLVWG